MAKLGSLELLTGPRLLAPKLDFEPGEPAENLCLILYLVLFKFQEVVNRNTVVREILQING